MIYGFVKQSGGGIMVQSELDHGTSMSILLPKNAIATEEITTHDNDQPTISREGQLVLLVEDDSSVRQVVRKQLLELGFPVIEAASAAEAKSLINQIPEISILLTDVIMPGSQNGREMATQAKINNPGLHVVIMSGYEELETTTNKTIETIATLSKPFTKKQLAAALGRI